MEDQKILSGYGRQKIVRGMEDQKTLRGIEDQKILSEYGRPENPK